MKQYVSRFIGNDSGATAIEYGLIVGVMSVVIISAFALFSGQLTAVFTAIRTAMGGA